MRTHRATPDRPSVTRTARGDAGQPSTTSLPHAEPDSKEAAKHLLAARALAFAQRVVEHADVDQSLEVLDRLEVAPRRQADVSRASSVQIVIGMPGQPIGSQPVFDVVTSTPAALPMAPGKSLP